MASDSGRQYLAIPGPSVMPERVLAAMHRPAPNIYEGELVDMVPGLVSDLKAVARTRHHAAIYIANGHGTWEAALANVIGEGDLVVALSTGPFGIGWAEMAEALGARAEVIDFGNRSAIDASRLAERLAADTGHEIRAVLVPHVDTGTSIRNDITAVRAAMDEAGHPALLMADCIASFACDVFEMDAWGVDVTVTACQKGLMTPPGMGYVFYGPRAAECREAMARVSRYWDWKPRTDPEIFSQYFDGTAPTHLLFGQRVALDMILEEGLPQVWDRHRRLAGAYWAAFDAWAVNEGGVELNVADPACRSHAVTALRVPHPGGTAIRDWMLRETGITLGIGLGMAPRNDPAWHGFFRIGHMGHVNAGMVMGVVGGLEAALAALDIPHRPGGAEAAARMLAA